MRPSRTLIAVLLVGYLAPLLPILIDAALGPADVTNWIFSLHSLAPASEAVTAVLRHLSFWWFFYSIAIICLSAIVVWVVVLTDSSMSLMARTLWFISMLIFGTIAVPAYCVLRLWRQPAVATGA